MSNRLVITEEEKQTIKRLYESAPPPDESVLVDKKNPYNYSEYKSACRVYSKDLVDGDLFYKSIETNLTNEVWSKLERWLLDSANAIFKKLNNKTIRIMDEICSITFYETRFTRINRQKNTTVVFTVETEKESNLDKIYIQRDGNSIVKTDTMELDGSRNIPKEFVNTVINGFKEYDKYHKPFKLLKNGSDEDIYNNHLDVMKMIPDEYFEIRKIVRTKTDF